VAHCFSALEIIDAHGAERLERAPVTPGEIRIGDRGFGNRPDGVRAISAGPGDYVVRVNWRGLRWLAPAGGRFDVQDFLARLGDQPGEAAVLVGSARDARFAPLPARLIAVPLPADKAEQARTRARRASRKAGHRVQPGTLHAAGFLLLLTSLDAAAYPALQVARLYRLRWQAELAIKRLKSLLCIDRLPAKSPALARAWLLAHLIAAFLTDELIRDMLPDAFPSASETPLRSA
jgi:IS4 transposase